MTASSGKLTVEMQVILPASKSRLLEKDVERLRELLSGETDWQSILDISRRHKVFPRVSGCLGKHFCKWMPADIYHKQLALARSNFIVCASMTKYLFWILELFRQKNIWGIPYKGPVLASYLFDDISLRSYCDLDLLISQNDFPRVHQALLENGYRPEIDIDAGQLSFYAGLEDNLSYFAPKGVCVEIHWELSGRYLKKPMGFDFVQRSLTTTRVLGRDIDTISAENLLIYFCLHGTKHCWEQLDLVSCVAELIWKTENIDWEYVFRTTEEYSCRRMIFVGLLLAERLYGSVISDTISEILRSDAKAVFLSEKIYKSVYGGKDDNAFRKDGGADSRFSFLRMRIRDSRVDVLRYGLRLLFIPSKAEWRAVRFPASLMWMYFVIRPFRVIGAGFSELLGVKKRRYRCGGGELLLCRLLRGSMILYSAVFGCWGFADGMFVGCWV
jgi:hypothetical protein